MEAVAPLVDVPVVGAESIVIGLAAEAVTGFCCGVISEESTAAPSGRFADTLTAG